MASNPHSGPGSYLGNESTRLKNRNWADRLPQPGYRGLRYRPGGLVFVSMNPGAGLPRAVVIFGERNLSPSSKQESLWRLNEFKN